MRIKITMILLLLISITQMFAQSLVENFDYKRSSIYSILINHTEQQFASEIKEAFMQIPVPDKFNDHNLSVKVLDINEKLRNAGSKKENPYITEFFEKNNVASRLVARWFNRDYYTGQCDMELVKERGLYNASEFDKQLAMRSARGYALLQDAGEELIGNTFVLVNDIRYVDKNKGAKTASSVLRVLGTVAAISTGMSFDDITDNLGDMLETIKGFRVKINTFLYKLEWTDEQAALFYQEQYSSLPDNIKKANFDNARGTYKLKYVGKVESSGGTTSFLGINEDEPVIMVRKACQRAIDENIVDLQRNYEEFRIKTPLLTTEPLTASIGMKEGITPDSQFEVLEIVEKEDGTQKLNRVGIIEPIKNLIWDNRYMAIEEGAPGSTLCYTTFRKVSGKDFAKGMLIREMKNK
ncbi:MAG: hypothetical protein IKJ97_07740 [Bacteroidaceae bacterium]|nr:hypothetical protein [Bacteroidaceae bacterium]